MEGREGGGRSGTVVCGPSVELALVSMGLSAWGAAVRSRGAWNLPPMPSVPLLLCGEKATLNSHVGSALRRRSRHSSLTMRAK